MAAPKSSGKSQQFVCLQEASKRIREDNDCGVKAVAAAAQICYDDAHALLAAKGRKSGKGTHIMAIESVLYELGYLLVNDQGKQVCLTPSIQDGFPAEYFTQQYPKAHRILKSVTTHHPERFPNADCWKGRTFLMMTNRGEHILCIVNGETVDWTKGTSRRACKIVEVIAK